MKTLYFLGIDIGKETFHAAITTDGVTFHDQEVENTHSAIKAYFKELTTKFRFNTAQVIVCMEHTGIYSYPLLDFLTRQNISVCVEPALRIKQSQGMQRGKNDKIDATRIAKYLFKNYHELRYWKPKREVVQKLRALLVIRERLIRARKQFEVPIKENGEFIKSSISQMAIVNCRATIKAVKQDIKRVDKEISTLISQDSQLSSQVELATSVTGVGVIIATNIIVATNEFQDITNHKKFACYSGVAPFPNQSGKSLRGRNKVSHMANKRIKTLLHLGARSAIRHSPELKHYYDRKKEEGKPTFSVLNAVCNKLISRIFVCVKNKRMYEKIYPQPLV